MKTKEELNALKAEFENVCGKIAELPEEEMKQVTGGCDIGVDGFPLAQSQNAPGDQTLNGLFGGTYPGKCPIDTLG